MAVSNPKDEVTGVPAKEKPDQHPKEVAAEAATENHDGLVRVKKDGKTLHVHPSTVQAHKEAGWVAH